MNNYDEKLRELREKVLRKEQLEAEVAELERQYARLAARAAELDAVRMKEQEDVDRLEGGSLAAFFYNVIGKMDEKLTKEREEAYAAAVKYDAAARELARAAEDIARRRNELGALHDSERLYKEAAAAKLNAMKAQGGTMAEEILHREENIAYAQKQIREINEAVAAATRARGTAETVLAELDSAENWGWYDALGGGGLLSNTIKHDKLDEAQFMVEKLQSELRRVKTELADVKINADMQVNVEGFLRFADYFFDGLFVDWTVLDRIGQSKSQVENVVNRIDRILQRLSQMLDTAGRALETERAALDELVHETNM